MKLQVFMLARVLRTLPVAAVIVVLGLHAAGCAAKKNVAPSGILEADKYLFERATELIGKRKWLQAREYFRQLVDNYPQSAYRPDAKLGMGDTYLGDGSAEALVMGENEYKEFLTFYPTHARADYAQLKLGMCHFRQMLAAERDQTQTREALVEFKTFVQRFPTSALLPEARARLRDSQNRLSESEYRVGFFYYRNRWYPGAVERLTALLKSDPEYVGRDAVFFHLADSLLKLGRKAEALPYFDRLAVEFESSEYLAKAKLAIASLKAETPALDKKDAQLRR